MKYRKKKQKVYYKKYKTHNQILGIRSSPNLFYSLQTITHLINTYYETCQPFYIIVQIVRKHCGTVVKTNIDKIMKNNNWVKKFMTKLYFNQ